MQYYYFIIKKKIYIANNFPLVLCLNWVEVHLVN